MNLVDSVAAGLSSIAEGMASFIESFVGKPRHARHLADRYAEEARQATTRHRKPLPAWHEMGNWHQGDWKWPTEQRSIKLSDE